MNDFRSLLSTTAVVLSDAEEEEQLHSWDASIRANTAVADFVKGQIDVYTFADILEAIGVDIEDYLLTIESNLEFRHML